MPANRELSIRAQSVFPVATPQDYKLARGPGLIGVILNALLHGVMGLQCCHYYNYTAISCNDPKWMKIVIGVLLFAETASTAFDVAWIYDALINHYMDPSALTAANWLFATDPAFVGIIAAIVQMFFAWRIQAFTKKAWIPWLIRFMSLGSLFGGIGTAIAIHFVSDFRDFHRFNVIMVVWLASAVTCDTIIAISLSTHLILRRTGIPQTDRVIYKVTALTMANGLLVTLVATANLISFFVTPSALYLVFNFPLAKLYSNSLMSSLNLRPSRRTAIAGASAAHHIGNTRINTDKNLTSQPLAFVHVDSQATIDTDETKRDVEWAASAVTSQSEGGTTQ